MSLYHIAFDVFDAEVGTWVKYGKQYQIVAANKYDALVRLGQVFHTEHHEIRVVAIYEVKR